jgi:hypothetical protein
MRASVMAWQRSAAKALTVDVFAVQICDRPESWTRLAPSSAAAI